jgi:poly(A) polymerase
MTSLDPSPLLSLPGVRSVLAALPGARIVGGAVRDLLSGRPVSDVDVTTPWPPEQVMERLKAAGLRAIPTGIAHGTVTALAEGGSIEVTTLRQDVETDGRHAVVAFTDDFAVDAARRDFTINAMSLSADGMLYDYFGGADDLAAGRLRFSASSASSAFTCATGGRRRTRKPPPPLPPPRPSSRPSRPSGYGRRRVKSSPCPIRGRACG